MANEIKTQLRLPAELHKEVTRLADADFRSLNAEIVVLLIEAINARARVVQPDGSDYGEFLMNRSKNLPSDKS
jgi:hypothetical protein